MKAKLIKTELNFLLENEEGVVIASTSLKKEGLSLSLKNCQAIERGYDLDELAKIEYPICEVWNDEEALIRELAFKKGFQKALELLGDKKFGEEDLRLAMHFGQFGEANNQTTTIGFIQSLQQTEWDVEIDEEKEFIFDPAMGISQGHYLDKPKLDADGCLILKKI